MFLTVVYAYPTYFLIRIRYHDFFGVISFLRHVQTGIFIIYFIGHVKPKSLTAPLLALKPGSPKQGTTYIIGLPTSIPPPELDSQTPHNGMIIITRLTHSNGPSPISADHDTPDKVSSIDILDTGQPGPLQKDNPPNTNIMPQPFRLITFMKPRCR
jgi:hypothetical protein